MAEKKARGPNKAARAQIALLHELGALSATTAKSPSDDQRIEPRKLGSLIKRKLVGSTEAHGALGKRTVYYLTGLGQMAYQSEAPASERMAAAKKAPAKTKRKVSKSAADLFSDATAPAAVTPTAEAAPTFSATDIVGPRLITNDTVTKPGFYRMGSDVYHRDPCPTPALSSGLAWRLIDKSPLHAWRESPRCDVEGSEQTRRDPTYEMDIGSAVHALTFGEPSDIAWIDAPDFRDSRTKNWRAAARQQGKTPILKNDKARIVRMAEILQPVLEQELGCDLGDAYGEIVIAAQDPDGGGWRRTRCDLVRGDCRVILDLKTTGMDAQPEAAGSRLFDGAHVQEALTHRILDLLDPDNAGRRTMKFVSMEQHEPHGFSVIQIEGDSGAIAAQQLGYAESAWDIGISTKEWVGYAPGVYRAVMPPWKQIAWRMRAIALGIADEQGEPT